MHVHLQESPPEFSLMGDQELLKCLVFNLVENALKYSEEGKQIWISLGEKDNWLEFIIKDEGFGIGEQSQDKIFDRFYRDHKNIGRFPGTGLGLAIANRIVELHQGKIHFQSAEGIGTTFSVLFPIGTTT